jgi:hypothetical protein
LRQEIARFDALALGESDLYQFAVDSRLDRDRVKRLHRAKTGEIDRHISPLRSDTGTAGAGAEDAVAAANLAVARCCQSTYPPDAAIRIARLARR